MVVCYNRYLRFHPVVLLCSCIGQFLHVLDLVCLLILPILPHVSFSSSSKGATFPTCHVSHHLRGSGPCSSSSIARECALQDFTGWRKRRTQKSTLCRRRGPKPDLMSARRPQVDLMSGFWAPDVGDVAAVAAVAAKPDLIPGSCALRAGLCGAVGAVSAMPPPPAD